MRVKAIRSSAVFCQKRCDTFTKDLFGRFEREVTIVEDSTKKNLHYTAVDLYSLSDGLFLIYEVEDGIVVCTLEANERTREMTTFSQ